MTFANSPNPAPGCAPGRWNAIYCPDSEADLGDGDWCIVHENGAYLGMFHPLSDAAGRVDADATAGRTATYVCWLHNHQAEAERALAAAQVKLAQEQADHDEMIGKAEAYRERIAALEKALRSLEWAGRSGRFSGPSFSSCPACGVYQGESHGAGCFLITALAAPQPAEGE